MNQSKRAQVGLTEGVIWKQLLSFFFPIAFGTFFQQLYNTVDAMVVGQFCGAQALAAVGGATSTLINLIIGLFVGIASGTTVVVSQYCGAKDAEGTSAAVHTGVALSLAAGLFLTVFGYLISPGILEKMHTPADVLGDAIAYIRIYFLGIISSLLYNVGSGILRAGGDSKRPLYFLIVGCVVNIVLDLLFVAVLGWGVAGAAIATVLSQVASVVLTLWVLMRTDESYKLDIKKIRFHKSALVETVRIGLPAGLQSIMYSSANLVIQSSVNFFGTATTAAWAAYGKIDSFFWMIMSAFGVSITTFVGQNFGALKLDRIKHGVRVCLAIAFGASIGISLLLIGLGEYIFGWFTNDQDAMTPEVIAQGMSMMHTLTPFFFTYVCVEILAGTMRGVGEALVPMILTALGVVVLRIVWVLFIAPNIMDSVNVMLLGYPISWTITSIMLIIYYKKGKWFERRMATRSTSFPLETSDAPES